MEVNTPNLSKYKPMECWQIYELYYINLNILSVISILYSFISYDFLVTTWVTRIIIVI